MPATWDLALDSSGNIAIATEEYQQAQDIASSCRVFYGDDFYSKTDGIPYVESILGQSKFPLAMYQRSLHDRAMLVPEVVSVEVQLNTNTLRDRILTGSIIFTNENGIQGTVGL